MFSDWEWVTLDKLGKLSSGKSMSKKVSESFSLFFDGNIPLVDGNSISSNRLYISSSKRFFNLRGASQNKLFSIGTVCFIRCGEVGNSSLLKINSCLTESIYSINSFESISDPKFIKYCFDFSRIKEELLAFSKTTTRNILSFSKLSLVKFPKPPLEVQQKIGNILANYDLILDNHEKQIKLLKELKKSLFREWFIKLRFPGGYESYGARGGYLKVE